MFLVESGNLNMPTVSIGMPVYNAEKYLAETVESLLSQSFEDFELIISDNASTDRTEQICKEYAAKDRRIRYIRQPVNLGPQANFTYLLNQASGEFFMWAASDDLWDREFIKTLLDALKSDQQATSAFCTYMYIDENNNLISKPQVFDYSGKSVLLRLFKFNFYYNDAFFYGIHRRAFIKDATFPVWWWINSNVPMDICYPILVFFLSRGGYVHAGSPPLWFNRLYRNRPPRHNIDFHGRYVISYFAFLLRQVNAFYKSIISIYKGSNSLPITLVASPFFAIRCIYNCIYIPISSIPRFIQLLMSHK